jgi:8-oxo-dGTP pyrophosphatase MutT (NUDIX family)
VNPGLVPNCQRGAGDVLYDNPGFGAALHGAVTDDAGSVLYDLPINWDRGGGAVTIPISTDGNIGFVYQFRPAVADPMARGTETKPLDLSLYGRRSLELPRGFPKEGESWTGAAQREAQEELLLPVEPDVRQIGSINTNTATTVHSIGVFVAWLLYPEDPRELQYHEPGEEIERRVLVPLEELPGRIDRGEIFCGITLAALMKYQAWIATGGKRSQVP